MDGKDSETTNEHATNSTEISTEKCSTVQEKNDEKLIEMNSVQPENNEVLSFIQASKGKRKYSFISDETSNNELSGNPSIELLGCNLSCGANEVKSKKHASFKGFSENFKIDFGSKTGLVRVYGRKSSTNGEPYDENIGESNASSFVHAPSDESEISTENKRWHSFNENTNNVLGSEKVIKNARFDTKNSFEYSSSFSKSNILPKNKQSDNAPRKLGDGKISSHVASPVSFRNEKTATNGMDTLHTWEMANAVAGPSGIRPDILQNGSKYRFECNLCGKEFVESWDFDIHYRTYHTKEKTFVCERKFTEKADVDTHNRAHSGEKPNVPNVCKTVFTNQNTPESHYRTHTEDKPYMCERGFSQQENLENPYTMDTGKRIIKCYLCGRVFPKMRYVESHIRRMHC